MSHSLFSLSPQLLGCSAYQSQWHLHGRLLNGQECRSVNAEKAWCHLNGYGNKEVVIAFADDGCLIDAVDSNIDDKFLAAAFMKNGKLNYASARDFKDQMFIPGRRHGTALAGLIAGPVNNSLPVGVAPGCRLLPVRWEYNGRFQITPRGFHTILNELSDKIDIFVNTWASLPHMNFPDETVRLMQELAHSGGRRGKGILFVWLQGIRVVRLILTRTYKSLIWAL